MAMGPLDANAAAGPSPISFAVDLAEARSRCAACGTTTMLAATIAGRSAEPVVAAGAHSALSPQLGPVSHGAVAVSGPLRCTARARASAHRPRWTDATRWTDGATSTDAMLWPAECSVGWPR